MVMKIEGSVVDVFRRQGATEELHLENIRNRGLLINKSVIIADIGRTALVDFSGKTYRDFRDECLAEKVCHEQYAQGNFDGGAVIEAYVLHFLSKSTALYDEAVKLPAISTKRSDKIAEAEQISKDWSIAQKSLRFAYRDDQGILCAVGFVFHKDKPDNWVLQIIKNTTAAQELRTTTLFAQGEIVTAASSTQVRLTSLPKEIKLALNSVMVNKLISGLIGNEGKASLEKYNELSHRIVTGHNLDDRDNKQIALAREFDALETELPNNPRIEATLKRIKSNLLTDPNFFVDKFANTLQTIRQVKEYEKSLSDFKGVFLRMKKPDMTIDQKKFHTQGLKLLKSIEVIAGNDAGTLDEQSLSQLINILKCSADPKNKENIAELVALSLRVSGHAAPLWKSLGAALLVFAGLALVVAGVLAAIPSGGSSLMLTVAGAVGISAGLAGGAGFGLFSYNSQKGLAKSVSDFRTAIGEPSPNF